MITESWSQTAQDHSWTLFTQHRIYQGRNSLRQSISVNGIKRHLTCSIAATISLRHQYMENQQTRVTCQCDIRSTFFSEHEIISFSDDEAVVAATVMMNSLSIAYIGGKCPKEMRNSSWLSWSCNTSVISMKSSN